MMAQRSDTTAEPAAAICVGARRGWAALNLRELLFYRELVKLIARLPCFAGVVRWDVSTPDGQPRGALDTSRAREGSLAPKWQAS